MQIASDKASHSVTRKKKETSGLDTKKNNNMAYVYLSIRYEVKSVISSRLEDNTTCFHMNRSFGLDYDIIDARMVEINNFESMQAFKITQV